MFRYIVCAEEAYLVACLLGGSQRQQQSVKVKTACYRMWLWSEGREGAAEAQHLPNETVLSSDVQPTKEEEQRVFKK